MKKTAVFIGILFFCFLGIANNSTPLFIRAISYEKDSIDGFLQIEFELVAFDSILVDSAYALDLPDIGIAFLSNSDDICCFDKS